GDGDLRRPDRGAGCQVALSVARAIVGPRDHATREREPMKPGEPCRERGSVSVVAAALLLITVVLALGCVDVLRVLSEKDRAQTAADAAALAAAQELVLPSEGSPAEVAT